MQKTVFAQKVEFWKWLIFTVEHRDPEAINYIHMYPEHPLLPGSFCFGGTLTSPTCHGETFAEPGVQNADYSVNL